MTLGSLGRAALAAAMVTLAAAIGYAGQFMLRECLAFGHSRLYCFLQALK